jgi:hypothetical protein
MVRGVWQDDNTKVFTDTITESFPEDTHAEAKPSSPVFLASVGVTHLDIRTRWSTPLQRLRHAKSTKMISD